MQSKVCIGKTKFRGKGVFAKADIKKGELILRRKGKIVTAEELAKMPKAVHDHSFPLSKDKYLLSEPPAKFLNHSCEPNAGIVNNKDLAAMRDIKKGEEITYDYVTVGADEWIMKCRCGSAICRKIIGKYKDLDVATKRKYSKYVPGWVKKSV